MHRKIITLLLAGAFCGCASCRHVEQPEGRTRVRSVKDSCSLKTEHTTRDSITFSMNGKQFRLFHNSRKMLFDGFLVWLNEPAQKRRKKLTLTTQDVRLTLQPLLTPEKFLDSINPGKIIIDPGHGGADPGAAIKSHCQEKSLVLNIAQSLAAKLKQQNIPVHLTRESDKSMSIRARNAFAKKLNADILVSIHLNAASNRKAHGVETYILPPAGAPSTSGQRHGKAAPFPGNRFDAQNMILAYNIHSRLVRKLSAGDRGIKRARFRILRNAACPAVLVECGFLTNTKDAQKLHNTKYIRIVGESLAQGILDYIIKSRQTGTEKPKQNGSSAESVG